MDVVKDEDFFSKKMQSTMKVLKGYGWMDGCFF